MITKKPRKDRVRAGPGFLLKKKNKIPKCDWIPKDPNNGRK
jgi:hypothetical protein